MSVTSPWPQIGRDLDETYKTEYLFHQPYSDDNFLELLMPTATWVTSQQGEIDITGKFFGVKSFNIFIASKLYGWTGTDPNRTFDWDDPDSDFSTDLQTTLDRWDKNYARFASYQTLIWVDKYTALQVQKQYPDSRMPEMMDSVARKMQDLCTTTKGFTFMAVLTDLPQQNFFFDSIDGFFKKPAYKIQGPG